MPPPRGGGCYGDSLLGRKCQGKLGKTVFSNNKKKSTLIGKGMPQSFWKHIRYFLVQPTTCAARTRHFPWRADIFHSNNIFLVVV